MADQEIKTILKQVFDTVSGGYDGRALRFFPQSAEHMADILNLRGDEQGVRDPKRVEQVVVKVKEKASTAGLDPAIAEEIYRTIIGCFVRKEMKEFASEPLLS